VTTAAPSSRAHVVAETVSSLEQAAVALRRDCAHLQSEAARLDRAARGLRWTGPGAEQWRSDVATQVRSAEDAAAELRKTAWRIEELLVPTALTAAAATPVTAAVPAAAGGSR
jgi:hypothetical protein